MLPEAAPANLVDPLLPLADRLGRELVEATRRVARAVVAHEVAKTAFDAARREMDEAEHARSTLQNRLTLVLDREARGEPFDEHPDIPF
jgi:hypothetical protein